MGNVKEFIKNNFNTLTYYDDEYEYKVKRRTYADLKKTYSVLPKNTQKNIFRKVFFNHIKSFLSVFAFMLFSIVTVPILENDATFCVFALIISASIIYEEIQWFKFELYKRSVHQIKLILKAKERRRNEARKAYKYMLDNIKVYK